MAEQQNRAAVNIAKSPEQYKLKNNFPSWLKQFRNYAELLNINPNNVYRTFLSFMDDDSFGVIENLNLTNEQRNDFFDNATQVLVRTAIKNRQGERVPAEYMLRFRKQHDGESVEQYANELEKMALEAFPDDDNIRENRQLIQSFLMGVRNDELGVKLLEDNFQNLTQAVNAAARHCKALQTRRYIRKESEAQVLEKVYQVSCKNCSCNSSDANTPKPDAVNMALPLGFSQQNQKPGNIQPTQNPANAFQYSSQQPLIVGNSPQYRLPAPYVRARNERAPRQYRDKRNIQCYYCQKYGHYSNECWERMRTQNQPQQRKYCTYCGKFGHLAENCWYLNKTDGNGQQSNENPNLAGPNVKKAPTNPFHSS
jgi:hypothetical protein